MPKNEVAYLFFLEKRLMIIFYIVCHVILTLKQKLFFLRSSTFSEDQCTQSNLHVHVHCTVYGTSQTFTVRYTPDVWTWIDLTILAYLGEYILESVYCYLQFFYF